MKHWETDTLKDQEWKSCEEKFENPHQETDWEEWRDDNEIQSRSKDIFRYVAWRMRYRIVLAPVFMVAKGLLIKLCDMSGSLELYESLVMKCGQSV